MKFGDKINMYFRNSISCFLILKLFEKSAINTPTKIEAFQLVLGQRVQLLHMY